MALLLLALSCSDQRPRQWEAEELRFDNQIGTPSIYYSTRGTLANIRSRVVSAHRAQEKSIRSEISGCYTHTGQAVFPASGHFLSTINRLDSDTKRGKAAADGHVRRSIERRR